MIYNNALRPSTLCAMVLLLLAITGTAMWAGLLVDQDMESFDIAGLIFLALDLAFWTLSFLFFARVRWVRIATSILLHGLIVALLLALPAALSDEESVDVKVAMVALIFLGIGSCVLGILVLHGRSLKVDLLGPAAQADTPERVARRKRRRRRMMLAAAIVATLGLTYAAWRIVPLLIAEPTVTVNYISEYNRLDRPAGYDPNLDATPHYERFFANLSELPDTLLDDQRWTTWPAELDASERQALEQWVLDNEAALQDLKQAAACPHWWTEFQSEDGSLDALQRPPYLDDLRRCVFALTALVQQLAYQGDVDRAFEVLGDMHAMGLQGTRKASLVDQLATLAACQRAYRTVSSILARTEVAPDVLDRTRRLFASQVPEIHVPRFTHSESLLMLDTCQRSFTDDGTGDGRLIPARLYEMKKNGSMFEPPLPYLAALWICLDHPSRQETIALGRRLHAMAGDLAQRSPWQMAMSESSYEEELGALAEGCYLFSSGVSSFAQVIEVAWRGKTAGRALVAVLAISTYKAQEGHLPESLDELISKGLLQRVPMDPYSDGPLVYKVQGDDFTLYSVGESFFDDNEIAGISDDFATNEVYWPVDTEQ